MLSALWLSDSLPSGYSREAVPTRVLAVGRVGGDRWRCVPRGGVDEMKWRTIRYGDRRNYTVFAWLPMRADNGQTYWLRRMRICEQYRSVYAGFGLYEGKWQLTMVVPL